MWNYWNNGTGQPGNWYKKLDGLDGLSDSDESLDANLCKLDNGTWSLELVPFQDAEKAIKIAIIPDSREITDILNRADEELCKFAARIMKRMSSRQPQTKYGPA